MNCALFCCASRLARVDARGLRMRPLARADVHRFRRSEEFRYVAYRKMCSGLCDAPSAYYVRDTAGVLETAWQRPTHAQTRPRLKRPLGPERNFDLRRGA